MKRPPERRFGMARLSLFLASLTLVGCQSRPERATFASSSPPDEASVKPGINQDYLRPDLNASNWVERFEKEGREIYDQREKIAAATRIRPGMAVADIGAGTGLFTPMLARQAGPNGRVYAVDIVPAFLKLIETRCAAAGLRNVQTVHCSERSVDLPPNSIDRAFICDVYHHFEYPRSSLSSLHRALRRNGEVLLIDFKRIPGVSSDWVLNHVRAGQDVVTSEFLAAGFVKIEELPLLKDNYVLRFRKGFLP